MKRPPKAMSGYPDPEGGGLIAGFEDYLVAVVRHDHAQGDFDVGELEARLEAALRGDFKRVGLYFRPCSIEYILR